MPKSINIEDLQRRPIPQPALDPLGTGCDYRSALRERLRSTQVIETNLSREHLISCSDLGLLGKNYYYAMVRKKPITDPSLREAALNLTSPTIWLRQSIAHDLRLVDAALAEYGLRLYLLSGYRSPDLQRLVRQLATIEQEREFTERMLANPEVHLSHATGAAFDIEIWEQTTERLLPTKIPEHFERDYLESKPDLTPAEIEVRDNRRLIHNILTTDVVLPSDRIFIPHPFEYWHYARHEKLSTVFATFYGIAHEAFYPEIPAHLLPQQQAES